MCCMTDEITLEKVLGFLQEAVGFRLDQAQVDGVRVMIDTLLAKNAYDHAPPEVVAAMLGSVEALAVQLMDRLRADPSPALDGTLATRADVEALAKAAAGMGRAGGSVDLGPVLEALRAQGEGLSSMETYLEALAAAPDARALDTTRLLDRFDALERRTSQKIEKILPGVADALAEHDQQPAVQAQLDTLTKLLLTPRSDSDTRLDAVVADMAELCEDVAEVRHLLDLVLARLPQAYIPLEAVGAGDVSLAAAAPAAGEAEKLPADDLAAALDVLQEIKERRAVLRQYSGPPGCYWNEDGTITCRDCGIAKDPYAEPKNYYKDKAAATGFKSRCVDCERRAKGYPAKASRAA